MDKNTDKLTKRKMQAINTKKIILNTAIELMEKSGFDGVTIEDICREAGVSVGNFYHYFKSKIDVFIAIFDRADEYYIKNNVEKKLNNKSCMKNIKKYFLYYAKLNYNVGYEKLKLLFNPKNKFFVTKGRYLQVLLSGIIKKGQKNAEITNKMSNDEIVDYLFTMARGVAYHWCVSDGGFDIVERMQSYIDKILPAIKE